MLESLSQDGCVIKVNYHVIFPSVHNASMILEARRKVPAVKITVHILFLVLTSGNDLLSV